MTCRCRAGNCKRALRGRNVVGTMHPPHIPSSSPIYRMLKEIKISLFYVLEKNRFPKGLSPGKAILILPTYVNIEKQIECACPHEYLSSHANTIKMKTDHRVIPFPACVKLSIHHALQLHYLSSH